MFVCVHSSVVCDPVCETVVLGILSGPSYAALRMANQSYKMRNLYRNWVGVRGRGLPHGHEARVLLSTSGCRGAMSGDDRGVFILGGAGVSRGYICYT